MKFINIFKSYLFETHTFSKVCYNSRYYKYLLYSSKQKQKLKNEKKRKEKKYYRMNDLANSSNFCSSKLKKTVSDDFVSHLAIQLPTVDRAERIPPGVPRLLKKFNIEDDYHSPSNAEGLRTTFCKFGTTISGSV